MGCKYAEFNDEGRYNCKISDDECIYLMPNKNKCIKDGYLDPDAIDGSIHNRNLQMDYKLRDRKRVY